MLELTGGDPTKLVDIAKSVGNLYSDVALKIMYNSLLSGPATHIVNSVSNAFNTIYRPPCLLGVVNAYQESSHGQLWLP